MYNRISVGFEDVRTRYGKTHVAVDKGAVYVLLPGEGRAIKFLKKRALMSSSTEMTLWCDIHNQGPIHVQIMEEGQDGMMAECSLIADGWKKQTWGWAAGGGNEWTGWSGA
jgi:hypothetical protein